jgi:hypothetical protein
MLRCVGCGSTIPWDGRGLFAYTCPCGATLLIDDGGGLALPVSLVMAVAEHREIPHIDYYLGRSSHTSPEKEKAYEFLRSLGARWSWECEQCRSIIVERTIMELREGLYRFGIHPDLKKLVEDKLRKEAKP